MLLASYPRTAAVIPDITSSRRQWRKQAVKGQRMTKAFPRSLRRQNEITCRLEAAREARKARPPPPFLRKKEARQKSLAVLLGSQIDATP